MLAAPPAPALRSLAMSLAALPPAARLRLIQSLPERQARALLYDWRFWARPSQLAPEGLWDTWVILAGRGFGKTRSGAEWVRAKVERGDSPQGVLVGRTAADVRDVMVDGESGILATARPDFRPHYEPSKRLLTWPNGVRCLLRSADEPDSLRGPQYGWAWLDELCAWRFDQEAYAMVEMGLRLGRNPQACITTTPRPTKLLRRILQQPGTVVTRGSSYENRANLAPSWFASILRKYEGTTLGRQELEAAILEDVPGALWTRAMLDWEGFRLGIGDVPPDFDRIVVAVDPAVTSSADADLTGIIVAGVLGAWPMVQGVILADKTPPHPVTPEAWGRTVVETYREYEADAIVAETNNGGELVETVLRTIDRTVSYRAVHASRGKKTRAEPISSLYQQRKVRHVGNLSELEDEYCTWVPGESRDSPNRLDAAVWGLTELMLGPEKRRLRAL